MNRLRDQIADLLAHHPAFNLKDDGYSAEDVLRMADAVIRELEADYVLVPKGHTIARIRSAEKLGLTGAGE